MTASRTQEAVRFGYT